MFDSIGLETSQRNFINKRKKPILILEACVMDEWIFEMKCW